MIAAGPGAVLTALDAAATRAGRELGVDGPARLRERAEILGLAPAGRVSAGGTCRLVRAADGWIALNLARATDVESLEAWAERPMPPPVWDAVEDAARAMTAAAAVERAQLLGIPAARALAPEVAQRRAYLTVTCDAEIRPSISSPSKAPVVVDLSALWAGPLCARLLGDALDARVIKVESTTRPDGARAGAPEFWQRLNHSKELLALDLTTPDGCRQLHRALEQASIVVASARPRAFDALGVDPAQHVARGTVWVSITGYGFGGPRRNWVAFGDDAAVAGGAAVAAGGPDAPEFVGDAVADPLAGLTAAAAARRAWTSARAEFVDVAMARVVNDALCANDYSESSART